MGLPDSGKTTLSKALMGIIDTAVYWNADDVRQNVNSHLGFSEEDRITQAKTMKWLSDRVVESNNMSIVDFICPTVEAREAFRTQDAFVVWVDRVKSCQYDDTNEMFVPPTEYDIHVIEDGRSALEWASEISQYIFA